MKLTLLIPTIIGLVFLSFFYCSLNNIHAKPGLNESFNFAKNEAQIIQINAVHRGMKYSLDKFEVQAGSPVEIWFTNKDEIRHNLLIISPESLETVGKAADHMATTPKGVEKHWTPDIPEVLFVVPLLRLNETFKLKFIAPEKPGDYPFVCTFPTHWRMMNGTMTVKSTHRTDLKTNK